MIVKFHRVNTYNSKRLDMGKDGCVVDLPIDEFSESKLLSCDKFLDQIKELTGGYQESIMNLS